MFHFTSLTVIVLFGTLAGVFGDRACYLCNSYSDWDHTACVDPMSPYPSVNYTFCSNTYVCTRVSYITGKQLIVSRGCDQPVDTCNTIYKDLRYYYPDISSYNCYYCKSNYCNDASRLAVHGSLLGLGIFFLIYTTLHT